jgi:nucleoside-diphosphate-sugar epimerase
MVFISTKSNQTVDDARGVILNPLPAADLEHIVRHTAKLSGVRVFMTGGTGFFGRWLLESFQVLSERAEIMVLTRDPSAFHAEVPHLANVRLCVGDVRNFEFPDFTPDYIIHAATPSTTGLATTDPAQTLDIILAGTQRVLEFARRAGARRLLLTSSGAVYGALPPELMHVGEDFTGSPDPLSPRSAYGEGTRVSELLCVLSGVPTVVARAFAFVGPHLPLDRHFAIGNFIRDGLAGGPIRISGDGTPLRSYLHAADLAIWLWTILLRGQPGRAYNVGDDRALTLAQVARLVADYFHTDIEIAKAATPGSPAQRYVPSTLRAQEELGLKTRIPLEEALDRTVRWLKT